MLRTTRLYTPQTLSPGTTLILEHKTSHHLVKVLRAKQGMPLILFNGDGYNYDASLILNDKKNAELSINAKTAAENESPLHITLLQCLSRSDRMEATIQKAVELGINAIVPVMSEHSNYSISPDRTAKKRGHWKQVIISACEQSGRAVIPKLTDIQSFDEAITLFNDSNKFLLLPGAKQSLTIFKKPENDICIFIGPEGGFSPAEVILAKNNNYKNIEFGPRILRTETAGPAVISAIQTLWGDL